MEARCRPKNGGFVDIPAVQARLVPSSSHAASALDRLVLSVLQAGFRSARVRLMLWDGTTCYRSSAEAVATVRILDGGLLWRLMANPEMAFADGYAEGRIEVEGDLVRGLEEAYRIWTRAPLERPSSFWSLHRLWPNTVRRARRNARHHYDLGNEFYRLWLDRQMVYTCAYYPSHPLDLETAQVAKMDYVCRKLRLQPGERVVEAGCGWGALALHMARHYGVSVRAFNVSHEQIVYARQRARGEGCADRVEFVEDDYRNLTGRYDAFVSVGMVEHVGPSHYPALGEAIDRSLDPNHGRGLLHFIGRNWRRPLSAWIRKRLFPGAYPPTLTELAEAVFEPWNLSILDVENLRLHYAKTLSDWLTRFETTEREVVERFGAKFFRTWRLYLAGSQAAFTTGWMQLYQVTFARGSDNQIPRTRADLYRDPLGL